MAITNTDEFLAYSSFNSAGGITTSDTFNTWRKKTNGIINAIDSISVTNVTPSQLSLGAPIWTTAGALSTYLNGTTRGSFTAGAIVGTSLNVGNGAITAGSFNTVGTITYGTLYGAVVTAQTINSTNSITAASAIRSNGTLTGNSLAIQTGTSPVTASISNTGIITGSSLTVGTGAISCGAITGSSLNVGGSVTSPATGAVNSLSLAVGTNNTQFIVTSGGACSTISTITASSFNSTSSLRYKQNVQPLSNALDIIENLQGVTFDWKDTGKSDIGLIAEQVNEVLPQFVLKDEDGIPQAVDYGKLTSVLIEAVKELALLVSSK